MAYKVRDVIEYIVAVVSEYFQGSRYVYSYLHNELKTGMVG